MMLKNTLLYSLSANKELSEKIAEELGMELSEAVYTRFASGEIMIEPIDTVRDKDVFIIQSTCAPVHDNLFEILIFVDALRRSSAREINVVIPYFGYARQDRKSKPRQPITARLVADLLKVAGVDRVLTVDLHAPQIQGFFSCLVDELTAIPLFAHNFINDPTINAKDVVIVSPDHGGVNRARKVAERLNCPIAIIDKRRTGVNIAEVMNIIGNVKDKDCILVDDIIDTANSCCAAADCLKAEGAKSIRMACTHAVLSPIAYERIRNSHFDELLVTDSISLREPAKNLKIKVLSLAPMLAQAILRIQEGLPLSVVYEMYAN